MERMNNFIVDLGVPFFCSRQFLHALWMLKKAIPQFSRTHLISQGGLPQLISEFSVCRISKKVFICSLGVPDFFGGKKDLNNNMYLLSCILQTSIPGDGNRSPQWRSSKFGNLLHSKVLFGSLQPILVY